MDAQETAVQLCLPLRNAGFGAVGEAPGGVNPHFAVVRFDVADFRGVERDFAAVGDEKMCIRDSSKANACVPSYAG